MAWEKERAWIAEKNAKLVNTDDNELLFRRQLVRFWPAERDNLTESTLDYLYLYSTDNNTDPPVEQQFVDDPQADRLTYDGRWRVVSNEKTSRHNEAQWPGLTGIIQTLRYGFAQELSWDEARVINNEIVPGNDSSVSGVDNTTSDDPGDILMVEWVNLDPEYTRAMSTSGIMSGYTITDPVIRGVTYSGDWHRVAVTIYESELQDGSGRIVAVLARPQYTLNAYDTYLNAFYGATMEGVVHYLWNVPRDLAQGIITNWKATRRSAAASLNADNTVNLVLREFDPGATPVSLTTDVSSGSCSRVETSYYYWGVTNPDDNAYDITTFGNYQSPGYTYEKAVTFSMNDATFTVVIREIVTQTRIAYSNLKVKRTTLEEREDTQFFGLTSLPSLGAPGIGETLLLDVTVQPDCSIDARATTITATENVEIVSWGSEHGTVYEGTYQNYDGIDAYANSGQGMMNHFLGNTAINTSQYRVSMNFSRNDDGTHNGTVSAVPLDPTSSGEGGAVYTGFTYWNMNFREQTVKDENDDESVTYLVPEYFRYAVEYYDMDTYSEANVFQQILGNPNNDGAFRGSNGSVATVGNYRRLQMLIGRLLETSPGVIKELTEGVGDLTTSDPARGTGLTTNEYSERPPTGGEEE